MSRLAGLCPGSFLAKWIQGWEEGVTSLKGNIGTHCVVGSDIQEIEDIFVRRMDGGLGQGFFSSCQILPSSLCLAG